MLLLFHRTWTSPDICLFFKINLCIIYNHHIYEGPLLLLSRIKNLFHICIICGMHPFLFLWNDMSTFKVMFIHHHCAFDDQLKSLLLSSLKTYSTFIIIYESSETIFISLKRCDSRIECATFEDECSLRAGCLKKPKVCDLLRKKEVCRLVFKPTDTSKPSNTFCTWNNIDTLM